MCDFGSVLDSCKGLVRAIYGVLSVARGLVSGNNVFAMFWSVVRGLVSIRVKNTVFLQWFGQL